MNTVLVFAPYGYPYAIPLSIASLKAYLKQYEINSTCLDLNNDFYDHFDLFDEFADFQKTNTKYSEKSTLLQIENWTNRELFYKNILSLESIQNLMNLFVQKILKNDPIIVGFSIFNTNSWFSIELAKMIKEYRNEIVVVFGGPDCTANYSCDSSDQNLYNKLMNEGVVDFQVVGEGERSFRNLVAAVAKKQPVSNIKSVIYRQDNEIMFDGYEDQIANIDDLPYPDYSDFELAKYDRLPFAWAFPIVFSRGCNFNCAFCGVKQIWGDNKMRSRSPQNIIDEIKVSASLHPNDENIFDFKGAYANTSKKFLDAFSSLLLEEQKNGLNILWESWARINNVFTAEICDKLKETGCYNLVFGLESGSPRVCKDMRKRFLHEDAVEAFKNLTDVGIKVTLFILVGFPSETEEDFQMTLDFLADNAQHINQAYAMSECILSPDMASNASKWGVEDNPDSYLWKTIDNDNNIEIRKDRLQRFYKLIETLNFVSPV